MIETDEHQIFRKTLRDLFEREIAPHVDAWEAARTFPAHELFPKLGAVGLLGLEYEEAYGGMGADHSFTMIAGEEMGRISCGGVPMAMAVQMAMATPALARYGSAELKEQYLAPSIRGELVASIAVTEADAGSDVAGIRTRAIRDGDEWVINGSKLYITNGTQADWLCLLARTSEDAGHRSMSLIVVPTSVDGVVVSRKLEKLGMWSSDTAELSFTDVRVPVSNTIGEIGRGFQQQMVQFQAERLITVYKQVGAIELALERTKAYLRQREAFGASAAQPSLSAEPVRLAESMIDRVRDGTRGARQHPQQHVPVEQPERAGHFVLLLEDEPVQATPGDLVQRVPGVKNLLVSRADLGARRGRHPCGRHRLDRVHIPQSAPGFLQVGLQQEGKLATGPGALVVRSVQLGQPRGRG